MDNKDKFFKDLDKAEVKAGELVSDIDSRLPNLIAICDELEYLAEVLRVDASNAGLDLKFEQPKVNARLAAIRKPAEVLRKALNHYQKL